MYLQAISLAHCLCTLYTCIQTELRRRSINWVTNSADQLPHIPNDFAKFWTEVNQVPSTQHHEYFHLLTVLQFHVEHVIYYPCLFMTNYLIEFLWIIYTLWSDWPTAWKKHFKILCLLDIRISHIWSYRLWQVLWLNRMKDKRGRPVNM